MNDPRIYTYNGTTWYFVAIDDSTLCRCYTLVDETQVPVDT